MSETERLSILCVMNMTRSALAGGIAPVDVLISAGVLIAESIDAMNGPGSYLQIITTATQAKAIASKGLNP